MPRLPPWRVWQAVNDNVSAEGREHLRGVFQGLDTITKSLHQGMASVFGDFAAQVREREARWRVWGVRLGRGGLRGNEGG
jgi:hypothetical protein